jgi:polyphosphate kinase
LIQKIDREIESHSAASPGHIQFKMNALEDKDIVKALYRAAQAGVRIDLIVRDTCRLRPGIPGLSDPVRVISIVGPFLEHTRIFYFRNGGDEEYFIGSADCMKRNLEDRVEAVTPVEAAGPRSLLRQILDVQLADSRNAWDMQPDGSYVQRTAEPGKTTIGSQEALIRFARKRLKTAQRPERKKRKPSAMR